MKAALPPNSRTPLYYECKNCNNFIKDTEKYDRIYEENKDEIIAKFHERFAKRKTDEEKRDLLDAILDKRTSGNAGGGTTKENGAIILEPIVIPFYEKYTKKTWKSGRRGSSYMSETAYYTWVKPTRPPLLAQDELLTILKEIQKFENNQQLSKKQESAKEILKNNEKEKIGKLLEKIYDRLFDKGLKVYGKRKDKSFVHDPVNPTLNNSYQIIFSYPDMEIKKIGKCF